MPIRPTTWPNRRSPPTPGVRFTLAKNAWFIAGVDLPVTGPRPFGERYTAVLSLGY